MGAKSSGHGHVYFLMADNGTVKIGKSKTLNERIKALKVALPYELALVHEIFSEDHGETEKLFHQHFSNKRLNGEWFKLTKEDISSVKLGIYPEHIKRSIAGSYYLSCAEVSDEEYTQISDTNKNDTGKNLMIEISTIVIHDSLKYYRFTQKNTQRHLNYMKMHNSPKIDVKVKTLTNGKFQIKDPGGYRIYKLAKELGWTHLPVST